jgi:hypothetical protein
VRNGRWILPTIIYRARRVLLHAVNLRHGTDGFTSPPKEGVLRILPPLKPIVLGRVWTHDLGSSGKHANNYTTDGDIILILNSKEVYSQNLQFLDAFTTELLKYAWSVCPHVTTRERLNRFLWNLILVVTLTCRCIKYRVYHLKCHPTTIKYYGTKMKSEAGSPLPNSLVTLEPRSPWLLGRYLRQLCKSYAGANMVYLRANVCSFSCITLHRNRLLPVVKHLAIRILIRSTEKDDTQTSNKNSVSAIYSPRKLQILLWPK